MNRSDLERDLRRYYSDMNGKMRVTETTIKMRADMFMKVITEFGEPNDNPVGYMEYISNMNVNKAKMIVDSVYVVSDMRGNIHPDVERFGQSIRISAREAPKKEQNLTFDELIKTKEYWEIKKKGKKLDSREQDAFMISAFYLEFPIRNDLPNIKIRNFDINTDNFVNNGKYVLNFYKSAKSYGPKVMDIPEYINTEITKIKDAFPERVYLFLDIKNNKYEDHPMQSRIKTIYKTTLNKPVSVSAIRKAKINTEHKTANTLSEKLKVAERYSHSLNTEYQFYLSNETKNHESLGNIPINPVNTVLLKETTVKPNEVIIENTNRTYTEDSDEDITIW